MKILIPKYNIKVNDPMSGNEVQLIKKKIYILSDIMFYPFLKYANENKIKINKILKYYEVNQYFKNLDYSEKDKIGRVIIIRTGGIGDLIALSAIGNYILDSGINKVNFVTQQKYLDLFYFMSSKFKAQSFFTPVIDEAEKYTHNIRTIYFEGIIENSKDNWYEIQFNRIKASFDQSYGRPILEKNIEVERILPKETKNIIINLKASSPVRSSSITKEFIDIIKTWASRKTNKYKIFLFKRNLNKFEYQMLEELNDDKINLIESGSLLNFLKIAYQADFSISVDTSLIHFVEGIGKPGLGIYSSFPTEARTKYYKYTKCVNIHSPCHHQPCFIHTKQPGETCKIAVDCYNSGLFKDPDLIIAPCLNPKYNKTYYDQIEKALEDIEW